MKNETSLSVNGMTYPVAIDSHATLLRVVRDNVGLSGTKEGCDDSECGACMMLLDGKPVNSCSYLAMQAVGRGVCHGPLHQAPVSFHAHDPSTAARQC